MPILKKTSYERDLERKVVAFCASLGVRCHKLKIASEAGWPDRTLMYRGQCMFLELKRPGEKPEPLQQYVLDTLTKDGFQACWSADFEQCQLIILAWRRHVDDLHV